MHDFHMSPDVLVYRQLFSHTVKLTQLCSSVSLFGETVNYVDFAVLIPQWPLCSEIYKRASSFVFCVFYSPHYKIVREVLESIEEG